MTTSLPNCDLNIALRGKLIIIKRKGLNMNIDKLRESYNIKDFVYVQVSAHKVSINIGVIKGCKILFTLQLYDCHCINYRCLFYVHFKRELKGNTFNRWILYI